MGIKEFLYLVLVLSWGVSFVVALVSTQRAQTRFQRAYRAVHPDAPPLPGQRRGFERWDLRNPWIWRRITSQPVPDAPLEQLRQRARRTDKVATLLLWGGFLVLGLLGVIRGSR